MCVIAISPKGIKQPSFDDLKTMWNHNPHGAGYMFAHDGKLEIHKGFMEWQDFVRSVRSEHFTASDSVVYHFRISTQAGINPFMTHPFPLTEHLPLMKALDLECQIGIAHNGIIPLTSDPSNKEYSDTALFIAHYMTKIVRSPADILNPYIKEMIEQLGNSKFVLMDSEGNISTVGKFHDHHGILLSNENHMFFNWGKYYQKGVVENVLCV